MSDNRNARISIDEYIDRFPDGVGRAARRCGNVAYTMARGSDAVSLHNCFGNLVCESCGEFWSCSLIYRSSGDVTECRECKKSSRPIAVDGWWDAVLLMRKVTE